MRVQYTPAHAAHFICEQDTHADYSEWKVSTLTLSSNPTRLKTIPKAFTWSEMPLDSVCGWGL